LMVGSGHSAAAAWHRANSGKRRDSIARIAIRTCAEWQRKMGTRGSDWGEIAAAATIKSSNAFSDWNPVLLCNGRGHQAPMSWIIASLCDELRLGNRASITSCATEQQYFSELWEGVYSLPTLPGPYNCNWGVLQD
jgi:hypothetical protein